MSKSENGNADASSVWLAVRPFHVNGADFVIDATGSIVLACSEETDCPLRFSEREVNKDGHFICPNCGRLGQRMVEASPEQCDMTANDQAERSGAWLGLWRRAFIVGIISALPVTLLSDRWPWIIAVPIIGGTVWVVWADLRGNGKRPNALR